ncbi:unnamed protein product, partial [Iphiclides podalirius]
MPVGRDRSNRMDASQFFRGAAAWQRTVAPDSSADERLARSQLPTALGLVRLRLIQGFKLFPSVAKVHKECTRAPSNGRPGPSATASASSTVNIPCRLSSQRNMFGDNRGGAKSVGANLGVPKPVVAKPRLVKPGVVNPGTAKPGLVKPGVVNPGTAKPGLVKPGLVNPGAARPGVANTSGAFRGGTKPVAVRPDTSYPGPPKLGVPRIVEPKAVICSTDSEIPKPSIARPGEVKPGIPKVIIDKPGVVKPGIPKQEILKPAINKPGVPKPAINKPGVPKPGIPKPGIPKPGIPKQGVLDPGVAKPEAAKAGVTKPEITKPGVANPGLNKLEEIKPIETKLAGPTSGGAKPGAVNLGGPKPGGANLDKTNPGGVINKAFNPEGATSEDSTPGEAKPKNSKLEESQPGASRPGVTKQGPSRLEAAKLTASRIVGIRFLGGGKPSETKTGTAKLEGAKSEEGQPDTKATEDKPGGSNFGGARPKEVKPSEAKQGVAKTRVKKPAKSESGARGRIRRAFYRMAALISKVKFAVTSPPSLENNPITQYFEIGKEAATAGSGLMWKVHDAYRKSDGKECSVFIFDKRASEKLFKPKRRECMLRRIRSCVDQLEKLRHPRMLQIIHALEEGTNTFAFASESVLGSLHNILSWHESSPVLPGGQAPIMPHPMSLGPPSSHSFLNPAPQPQTPPFAKEYYFIDIELRYGFLQIIEALHYLHYTIRQVHRNVCPQAIIVTKRGTWKLFGLEFVENMITSDPTELIPVAPWSIKIAKFCQPSLDFLAPEVQTNAHCNILSDMFSLGLVICAVFNGGKPLLQANNNPMLYMKQIEFLDHQVNAVLPRVPAALQEAVQRLLSLDPHPRPTTQLLPLIKYFKCQSEPAIQAMQFLDVITVKDANQRTNFYSAMLIDALPYIPKKLRWQHVWPVLQLEVRTAEVLAAVLQPIIWLTNEASQEEFSHFVLPTLNYIRRNLINSPKCVQASVMILENLHVILKKCQPDEVQSEVMPLLFNALDSNTNQVQTASLIAIQNVSDSIEDKHLHNIVLGKVKILLEKNQSDVKIISLVLGFFEKVLTRLERNHILEHVIPTLLAMRLTDPDIINRVVKLYKTILAEQKFGLTTNVMATRMIPALAPQTVNPSLNADQFANLMEILYDMLENIDKSQRLRMKAEGLAVPSPERHRALRHQMSNDNVTAPPFNIPNLRVEQRKTSSAEDMARKNSVTGQSNIGGSIGAFKSKFSLGTGIGQWFFGSSNSANNDSNFLRVGNAFPNRRLSDNTLMTPKIRIAPSCASSPGGTPGGNAGLPTRRHSSIGPQERRGSAVNLSPPTAYQVRGRGGSGSSLSVPSTSHCVHNNIVLMRLIGGIYAEHVIECSLLADVVDAVDPLASAVCGPRRLPGVGDTAAAEQRNAPAVYWAFVNREMIVIWAGSVASGGPGKRRPSDTCRSVRPCIAPLPQPSASVTFLPPDIPHHQLPQYGSLRKDLAYSAS